MGHEEQKIYSILSGLALGNCVGHPKDVRDIEHQRACVDACWEGGAEEISQYAHVSLNVAIETTLAASYAYSENVFSLERARTALCEWYQKTAKDEVGYQTQKGCVFAVLVSCVMRYHDKRESVVLAARLVLQSCSLAHHVLQKIAQHTECTPCEVKSSLACDILERSIEYFLRYENFKDALCDILLAGGDTDSVGSLVGSLVGTLFGAHEASSISSTWNRYNPYGLPMADVVPFCMLRDKEAHHPFILIP